MPEPDLYSRLLPGDVILTSHLGFSPIKIGNFCKNGYSKRVWTHAALYLGDGNIVEAVPKGIVKRSLKEAYPADGTVGLRLLRKKNLSAQQVQQIVTFCATADGGPYDSRALIYFPLANLLPPSLSFILSPKYLGRLFNTKGSFFCSELVSEGFQRGNAYCFEREPFQVMPVDFSNDLLFDEIGTIHVSGKEKQGRVRALLLEAGYIAVSVLLWIVFLLIIAAVVAIAVLSLRRFWVKRPVNNEKPA